MRTANQNDRLGPSTAGTADSWNDHVWEKMEAILDGEDCWDIVTGTESEPGELGWVVDPGEEAQAPGVQIAAEAARAREIRDWKRRFKKAASLIAQSVLSVIRP